MFQDQNLLPAADYGRLAFDHFLLVQQFSPLLQPRGDHFSRGVVGSAYLQLGSKGREIYHKEAAACHLPLTQTQIELLKTFLTISQRNLSAAVVQYEKVVLVRTCYDSHTDATFARILSKYDVIKFASICDNRNLYESSSRAEVLRELPFLAERSKFARCRLMPRERQDKIMSLSPGLGHLRKNEAEIDRLLLMDNTHPAHGILATLRPADLKHWSSIVGVFCVADQKAMECGLVKLYSFDDESEIFWGTRISPEGLRGFMDGLREGKSVFELRHALRQYEASNGRRYSASELTDKLEQSPSSANDAMRRIAKTEQAELEEPSQISKDTELQNAPLAGDMEVAAREAKAKTQNGCDYINDEIAESDSKGEDAVQRELGERVQNGDVSGLEKELLASKKPRQTQILELENATTREMEGLAEASRAKEARSEAYAIAKGSGHTRETAEDDLRAAQHRQADLVVKLEDISADSGKQLSGCDMARSLTLEEKDVAVLEKVSLEEDFALERVKVAYMDKPLQTKYCVNSGSEEHVAKERTQDAENELAAQLGQITNGTGQEISDLKEQLGMEKFAGLRISEENERLAKQVAHEERANKELEQKHRDLESEVQKVKQELSATRQSPKDEGDLQARLGNEMGAGLIKREEMIDKLEKANRTLQEQLETARDAHKHLQRSYNTVETRLCIAKQARMRLERDLQSRSTHLGEELEQATKTKEEALKGMISMKNNLERKISEQAAMELRLKLECGKLRSVYARSAQARLELEEASDYEHLRLSVLLQKALWERDQASEDSTKSKDHLGAMYQKELEARVRAERKCHELHLEAEESRTAQAKKETDMGERESVLVRRLQSMDIGFLDELARRERAEQELRLWKWQHGVIALD